MLFCLCCCRRNNELIRGRAALLPVISSKDWRDIDWAISAQVWTLEAALRVVYLVFWCSASFGTSLPPVHTDLAALSTQERSHAVMQSPGFQSPYTFVAVHTCFSVLAYRLARSSVRLEVLAA
jgi:hypothetical protein